MTTTHHAPEDHAVDDEAGDRAGDADQSKLTGEAQERADEILKDYDEDDRPTVVLPGSHGTVSGTAVSDWLDDDGNPKYGKNSTDGAAQEETSSED
jgi:hypothetical protein